MLFYSSFTSSITIATDQVKEMFNFTLLRAGDAITVPMFVIAFSMPLLGALIDKIGKRLQFIQMGGLFNVLGHFIYLVHPKCTMCFTSYIPFVLYGLSYSVFIVAEWSSLSYVIHPTQLSTAYGILGSFCNIGYTVLPPLISHVHEEYNSYRKSEQVFILLGVISILMRISLAIWDIKKRNGILI